MKNHLSDALWALAAVTPTVAAISLTPAPVASAVAGATIGGVVALWRETRRRRALADSAIEHLTPFAVAMNDVAMGCVMSPVNTAVVVAHGAETDAQEWSIVPGFPRGYDDDDDDYDYLA